MRKYNEALDEAVDALIEDVCEKAEKERENTNISDDNDLFCLMDTLRAYSGYIDKAWKCKRVDAITRLHKKFNKYYR